MQESMKELELVPNFGDFLKSILMLCILEQDTKGQCTLGRV
jgi:hypothetical protein